MKDKHKQAYMKICDVNAELSECLRNKFGAVIVDPDGNTILAAGYNGYIRGGPTHCGGEDVCLRETIGIKSGTQFEIGCIHAEENAITNAGRQGVSTVGKWLFVNGEPCRLCARRIVQSGIIKVIFRESGYDNNGIKILEECGIEMETMEADGCQYLVL